MLLPPHHSGMPPCASRLRVELEPGEVEELAVEVDQVLGPQVPQQLEVLRRPRAAALERRVEDLELLLHPAGADAQIVRPPLSTSRVASAFAVLTGWCQPGDEHRGADVDPLGGRGGPGQRQDRVEVRRLRGPEELAVLAVGVLRLDVDGQGDVVGHPDRVEPQLLRLLGERRDRLRTGVGAGARAVAVQTSSCVPLSCGGGRCRSVRLPFGTRRRADLPRTARGSGGPSPGAGPARRCATASTR